MRLFNVPAVTAPLTYDRLFVERGGQVFHGSRDKLHTDNTVRLNQPAMDALLARLGLVR